ncbi:MAG: ankyrin repeat domain-containing protein [Bacteroidota bacterium]
MRKFSALARYRMIGMLMGLFVLTSVYTFSQVYGAASAKEVVILRPSVKEKVLSEAIAEESAALLIGEEGEEAVVATTALELEAVNPLTLPQRMRTYFDDHLPLIVSLWLLAVFALILRLLGQLAYIQRIKSYGVEQFPERWNEVLRDLEDRLEIRRKVQYLRSRLLDSPMTVGWWKPYVLFPLELLSGLSEAEVKSILAHELAHVRRNDYAFNLLQSLLGILYFYHPGSWWLSKRLSEEREHCCDDLAIELGADPRQYAKTIIRLKELQMSSLALSQNITGPKGESAFSVRILRLLRSPLAGANYREGFLTAMLLVIGLATAVQAATFGATTRGLETTELNNVEVVNSAEVQLPVSDQQNDPDIDFDLDYSESTNTEFAASSFSDNNANIPNEPNTPNEPNEPNSEKDELDLLIDAIAGGEVDLVAYFIERGVDLNQENQSGWTPLMVAASENELEITQMLVDGGAEIDHINRNGMTALIEAADEGSYSVAKYLINQGADLNLGIRYGRNAVVMAASEGHPEILELLLDAGAKLETSGEAYPVLHAAAEEGQYPIIILLLERGININAIDSEGRTALSYAAEENKNRIIRLLLDRGADPSIVDNQGISPRVYAAEENNLRGMELLAAAGAPADPQEFYAALSEGNYGIVNRLLEGSYDANYRFEGNFTPLMVAANEEESELVRILLEQGAQVNAVDDGGRTAMYFAAQEDSKQVVRYLINAGADLEGRYTYTDQSLFSQEANLDFGKACSVLQLAVAEGSADVVRELIRAGANPNARSERKRLELNRIFFRDNPDVDWDDVDLDTTWSRDSEYVDYLLVEKGWTPLMEAALRGEMQIVLMLLEAGADRAAETDTGMTAVEVARMFNQLRIINLLD